jgi:hypothetical protein
MWFPVSLGLVWCLCLSSPWVEARERYIISIDTRVPNGAQGFNPNRQSPIDMIKSLYRHHLNKRELGEQLREVRIDDLHFVIGKAGDRDFQANLEQVPGVRSVEMANETYRPSDVQNSPPIGLGTGCSLF